MNKRVNERVKTMVVSLFLSLCLIGSNSAVLKNSFAEDVAPPVTHSVVETSVPNIVNDQSNVNPSPDINNQTNEVAQNDSDKQGSGDNQVNKDLNANPASATPVVNNANDGENTTPTNSTVNSTTVNRDKYVTYNVNKSWEDKRDSVPVTIRLYADGKEVESISLSEENDWKGSFNKYPKYKDGKEIKYTIEEDPISGYRTSYSSSEKESKTYWLMVNAPEYFSRKDKNKEFAIAIQDWWVAQPNTYNWKDKYYLFKADDNGILFNEEIHANDRFKHLEYDNNPFKFDDNNLYVFEYNGKNVVEVLNGMNPDSKSDVWVLEDGNKLKNKNTGTYLTLKGIPEPDGRKTYSFVLSDKVGWQPTLGWNPWFGGPAGENYENILKFENANAFMSRIGSELFWGGTGLGGQQYMFLDWGHVISSTNQQYASGQFKFFTPVDEQIIEFMVVNGKIYFPPTPPTPEKPPVIPPTPEEPPTPPTPEKPPVIPPTPEEPPIPPTPEKPPVTPPTPNNPPIVPGKPPVNLKKSSNEAPKTYDSGIFLELSVAISSVVLLLGIRRVRVNK